MNNKFNIQLEIQLRKGYLVNELPEHITPIDRFNWRIAASVLADSRQ